MAIRTPAELANEMLRRRAAREGLIPFAHYTQRNYVSDPFHQLLASKLEAVERGEIDRLMITTPPRHGKTELSSIKMGAWFMGRNPGANIIQASYNLDQAVRSSRFTRAIIQSSAYRAVFPGVTMASDSRAADRWMLERAGEDGEAEQDQEYFAVGIGTGATGKGCHLGIIDDPFKDREEADSPSRRQTVWDWYNDVLYTRLERNARIIVINTRWHYDDLSGRLLQRQEKGGDRWHIVECPALWDDDMPDELGRMRGEALSPGRKTAEELERIKANVPERTWAALFQQRPISTEGALFQDSWFMPIDRLPLSRQMVRAWDFGSTTNGDWTVGVKMSRCPAGKFYIEDVVRFRGKPNEVERVVKATAMADTRRTRIVIPQDPGQAGVAQVQNYMRLLSGFIVKAKRPTGDKETRAAAFAAQAEGGMVHLKAGDWNKDFKEELGLFPLGSFDDQVDAASDAFNALLGKKSAGICDA